MVEDGWEVMHVNDTADPVECIAEIVHPDGGWVTIRVVSGRVDRGTRLRAVSTSALYEVDGFAPLGWKASSQGYRTVVLKAVADGAPAIVAGTRLVGDEVGVERGE